MPCARLNDPIFIVKKRYRSTIQTEEVLDLCDNCVASLEHWFEEPKEAVQ